MSPRVKQPIAARHMHRQVSSSDAKMTSLCHVTQTVTPSHLTPGDRCNSFCSRMKRDENVSLTTDRRSLLISSEDGKPQCELYPVYTIEQTSSWLVQLTYSSSSSQLDRVNGILVASWLDIDCSDQTRTRTILPTADRGHSRSRLSVLGVHMYN